LKDALTASVEAYNATDQTLTIGKTKAGTPLLIRLAPPVAAAIDAIPRHDTPWLFGYGYDNRRNVLRTLKCTAKRAGVRYYSSHKLGRHTFAARLYGQGLSSKAVAEAGAWASTKMVHERYGHLEKSAIDNTVLEVGIRWVEGLQLDEECKQRNPDFKRENVAQNKKPRPQIRGLGKGEVDSSILFGNTSFRPRLGRPSHA
jgi:Phage integrase family